MNTSVVRTTDLDATIATAVRLGSWSGDKVVAILPDRLHDSGGVTYAAFRQETQSLRAALIAAGLTVELVVPVGGRRAAYEEHDATWVLPVVMTIGSLAMGTLASVIGNWITAHISELTPQPRVRYREAHQAADGSIEVLEIDGPGEDVVRVIKARYEL